MRIIVDAMGGDNAPDSAVFGAVMAAEKYDVEIVLTGRGEDILKSLDKMGKKELPRGIEIANAPDVISMEEDPVIAIREKKDSSMVVGLRMLKEGVGDALVSAGSTGALLSGATLIVKRVHGIRRAAMAPYIPTSHGGFLIIDCGANVECTPEYLLQFAFMGSYYAENALGVASPRIGLLNNGSEKTKGTDLQIDTYALLEKAARDGHINFAGNVEGKEAMAGACDVIVCDGFSGNVMLKTVEGAATYMMGELKSIYKRNLITKLSALMIKKQLSQLREKLDPDRVGGTMLLGISKPVIKAHGSSSANAVAAAIHQAELAVKANIADKLEKNIEQMKTDSFVEN